MTGEVLTGLLLFVTERLHTPISLPCQSFTMARVRIIISRIKTKLLCSTMQGCQMILHYVVRQSIIQSPPLRPRNRKITYNSFTFEIQLTQCSAERHKSGSFIYLSNISAADNTAQSNSINAMLIKAWSFPQLATSQAIAYSREESQISCFQPSLLRMTSSSSFSKQTA